METPDRKNQSFSSIQQIQQFVEKNNLLPKCDCGGRRIVGQKYGSQITLKKAIDLKVYCIRCRKVVSNKDSLKLPISEDTIKQICDVANNLFREHFKKENENG